MSGYVDKIEVQSHYRALASHYNAKANKTCERIYEQLVRRHLAGRRRVLELGGGSSGLLASLGSPVAATCDFSLEMLRMRSSTASELKVVAVGERLPFQDAEFDAVLSVNVLEHVTDLERVVAESARVLQDGAIWLAVTPNGDWERWLDLAERWRLKIPEGPHEFLTPRRLRTALARNFEVIEQRTMLVVPAGPPALAAWLDRLTACSRWGWGFFQFVVARRASRR
jgi:2-polyprenyl-6-hydroxyphenyl methylase/3-demethylubiquinone-9 3-methyltransferase